jgi:hypothetical protein
VCCGIALIGSGLIMSQYDPRVLMDFANSIRYYSHPAVSNADWLEVRT